MSENQRHGKKVSILTLGCKVNQYESEAMAELFKADGYKIVGDHDFADVYVINTCTVTNLGDKKSRQYIRRAKKTNQNALIAVVGCYSQVSSEEIMKIEGVNLILGTDERKKIVSFLQDLTPADQVCYVGDIMKVKDFEEMEIEEAGDRTRAFVKIQEGCNQFCSYCIIPYARGPVRSRIPENVIKEVAKLAHNGFKEIVLTGIHVASYGLDFEEMTLVRLIQMVHEIEGIERIRLSSVEPRLINRAFLEVLQTLPKFCPHFHLSLQSGSNTVLKRMNRKYDTVEYRESVELIRSFFPTASLTTDIIVGFPGETDEEFEETIQFVKQIEFHQIHVFKYSPKKGTKAASMDRQIHPDIKNTRSERLIVLSETLEKEYIQRFIGSSMPVLFESVIEGQLGLIEGHTDNYIKTVARGTLGDLGTIRRVLMENAQETTLFGKIN